MTLSKSCIKQVSRSKTLNCHFDTLRDQRGVSKADLKNDKLNDQAEGRAICTGLVVKKSMKIGRSRE